MKKLLFLIAISLAMIQCKDVKETAYNEFKVSTLLKKYEYFKDLSAAIDKKKQT